MASFTIDPDNRLIILDQIAPVSGFVTIDVQIDLYSEMKRFWKDNGLSHGLIFPWSPVGGTPYGGGRFQGTDYFLRNDLGWRIRPYEADHELQIIGNLRPLLASLPTIIPTLGDYTVYAPQERSGVFQVVETEGGGGGSSAEEVRIEMDANSTKLASIDGKTINLPVDPADQSAVESKIDAQTVDLKGVSDKDLTEVYDNTPSVDLGTIPEDVTAIKERTDNLPDDPAGVADLPSEPDNAGIASIDGKVDTQVSSRLADADYTAPDNAKIADIDSKVDVAISTRLAEANYVLPDNQGISDIDANTDIIKLLVEDIAKLTGHKVVRVDDIITIYESDGNTVWREYNLANRGRVEV